MIINLIIYNGMKCNMYVDDIENHLNYLPTGCSYESACLQKIVIRPLFEGDFSGNGG